MIVCCRVSWRTQPRSSAFKFLRGLSFRCSGLAQCNCVKLLLSYSNCCSHNSWQSQKIGLSVKSSCFNSFPINTVSLSVTIALSLRETCFNFGKPNSVQSSMVANFLLFARTIVSKLMLSSNAPFSILSSWVAPVMSSNFRFFKPLKEWLSKEMNSFCPIYKSSNLVRPDSWSVGTVMSLFPKRLRLLSPGRPLNAYSLMLESPAPFRSNTVSLFRPAKASSGRNENAFNPTCSSARLPKRLNDVVGTELSWLSSKYKIRRADNPAKALGSILDILFWPKLSSSKRGRVVNTPFVNSSKKFRFKFKTVSWLSPWKVVFVTEDSLLWFRCSSCSLRWYAKLFVGMLTKWFWERSRCCRSA